MILSAALLIICAALNTQLSPVESAVLFDSKNVTEYTIRLPTLKTPNIFKRLAGSGRKPAKNNMGSAGSSSSLNPAFGLPGGMDGGANPLKFSKNSGFSPNMPYAFSQMSFAPVKGGRGSMPVFKYTGPTIWASDPRLIAKGNYPDGLAQLGNKNLQFSSGGKAAAWFSPANNKLPEESQNNMRVVVLRAPLDGLHGDDDPSLEESRNYRKFHKHKSPMEPEIQIINIPPRRNQDKRRFFGSQRPMAGSRPTIIRLPMSHGNQGFGPPFSPAPPMHLDVPKQFIAEEKPLGNGRNTYIISEVDPNKQNSLNSLGNMDFGKNENFHQDNSDDWNLALPMKKSSQNMGPNFGSDYGSLLELQNAKQRHQSNSNKNPVVIALSAKDQKAASSANREGRPNIQVLRTDSDSKVLVPPGMIAILVPQSFGIGSAVNGPNGLIPGPDFDEDSAHSFFESSSTNKKTIVPLRSSKIEPSKSPGPPYKVDFTQGLPANSIAKPDFYPNFQNRMGEGDSGSNEIASRSPTSAPLGSLSISAAPSHQIAAHLLRNTHEQIQSSIKQNTLDIDSNTLRKRSPTQQALRDDPYRTHSKLAPPSQTTTTAPTLIHTHYRSSPSKTSSAFPKNHQSQHPTPAPYPPAAFDTESAGIYLPRAAALRAPANNAPVQHNPQVFPFHRTYSQVERRVGRQLST